MSNETTDDIAKIRLIAEAIILLVKTDMEERGVEGIRLREIAKQLKEFTDG